MVYRLIYSSRAIGHVWLQVAQDIVSTSLRNNPKYDLTGCLCCSASGYLQVLEGSGEAVDALFAKIRSDPRHADVRLSERVKVPERQFGAWAMAFAPRLPSQEPIFEKHMSGGTTDFSVLAPEAQLALLQDLVPMADRMTRNLLQLDLGEGARL